MRNRPVIVLKPQVGLAWPDLRELWASRELLYLLARRDVKIRYAQTVLGILWVAAQPLFMMLAVRQFVARGAGTTPEGLPTALFLFAGLMLWTYFAGVVAAGAVSLATNSALVTKVYFPRILVPLASTLSGLVDLMVNLVVLAVLAFWFGLRPTIGWLWLFPLFASVIMSAQGFAVALAAISVRFRDVRHAVPFLLQFGMLASPVFFPESSMPSALRIVNAWSPIALSIRGLRSTLNGASPAGDAAAALILALGIWLAGAMLFTQHDRSLADRV